MESIVRSLHSSLAESESVPVHENAQLAALNSNSLTTGFPSDESPKNNTLNSCMCTDWPQLMLHKTLRTQSLLSGACSFLQRKSSRPELPRGPFNLHTRGLEPSHSTIDSLGLLQLLRRRCRLILGIWLHRCHFLCNIQKRDPLRCLLNRRKWARKR